MRLLCALLIALLSLPGCAAQTAPAPASEAASPDESWQAFGHALTLVETLVGIAARSDDPQTNLKDIDEVLAGRNAQANSAIAGILGDVTSDLPSQYRDKVAAIGRDLTAIARREIAKAPAPAPAGAASALQARKDLNAMGLSYYDAKQFLDVVKRDDALAVELYVRGGGVNLSARDADGRTGLEIARANGNARIAELLARNLPATH